MARNRIDERDYERIADELGISAGDARNCVVSFFDAIEKSYRNLPFANPRKIFSRQRFADYVRVWCIPALGRIGPSYDRYLKWRANEAKEVEMVKRSDYKSVYTEEEIENLARKALHEWKEGDGPVKIERKSSRDYPFERIWLVGPDGKKQAKQVIPKKQCSKSKK